MAADGQTPIGYDIDINRALAKVMGLQEGTTKHSEFPTIIPALGTKFDVGLSSFTITSEREQQVNMISYLNVGSAWGVAQGNPKNFDPSNPCGRRSPFRPATAQETYANDLSNQCVADGKEKIAVMPHELQTDIATKLISGQYDATPGRLDRHRLHERAVGRKDRPARRHLRIRTPGRRGEQG